MTRVIYLYRRVLVSYGQRFRELRLRAKLSQEAVAERLDLEKARGGPVSNIELRTKRVPKASTVLRHAEALRCKPWELLAGVPTDYDLIRTPTPLRDGELSALLWGLAFVPAPERLTVLEAMQSFLDALPPGVVPSQALQSDLVKTGITTQRHRGKKRA